MHTRQTRFAPWLTWLLLAFLSLLPLALAPTAEARDTGMQGNIRIEALPPEARATLQLIRQGGPFPYRRDGITFQNRERRLPLRPPGYYREYTVPTPGLSHRGARRIVAGEPEEFYYTADHYRSFRRIVP